MSAAWLRAVLEAVFGFVAAVLTISERAGARSSVRIARSRSRSAAGWMANGQPDAPTSRRGLLADDNVDESTRNELASAWREAALGGHAALAASTQRALDLVGLGAPSELVMRAHEDALDEVRRVKLYFEIARGIDGRGARLDGQPTRRALPRSRMAALALLATETALEVALAASRSSRMTAKLARRTTDATIRTVLEEVAAAEARRIAHAWAVIRWCLVEGGGPIEQALRALVGRLPAPQRSLPREALDGGWERWGIAGAALERQEHAHACELVERDILELVASASGRSRLAAA